jgi:hypothetical protein
MKNQGFKKSTFLLGFIAMFTGSAWAGNNPANMPVTPTIASLRAIPVAAATLYPNIQVQDYYGTGSGCPIQYKWNAADSTADDSGAIINPTGNVGAGRWNLNLPPASPLHSCVYGVKIDVPFPNSGGGTDQKTQLQAALNWAHNFGPNWVHLDSKLGYCIQINSTISPLEGEILSGNGSGQAGGGKSGSCLIYTPLTGYIIQTLSVQSGIGTTPFESPKLRDFTLNYGNSTVGAGGCVQFNQISGGFLDDPSTQQNFIHPELQNIVCNMGYISGMVQIGFQCSKCLDGRVERSDFYNGGVGVDLEGSDNIRIGGGGRISNTYDSMVKFVARNTFGNNDTLEDVELLALAQFGQAVDSMVYNAARSSTISKVFFEASAPAGGSLAAQIHLSNGFIAGIHDNQITANATNWLIVDGNYQNITAINNGTLGVALPPAKFNAGAGLYFYSSAASQALVHYGNSGGADGGWPFNTVRQTEQWLFPKVELSWTPSYDGLQYSAMGTTIRPVGNVFPMNLTGATNYLDFRRATAYLITGTFDISVHAWQSAGTGTLSCQVTDSGTPVGAIQTAALTVAPAWFAMLANVAVTVDGGVRCWTSDNRSVLAEVNLVDH